MQSLTIGDLDDPAMKSRSRLVLAASLAVALGCAHAPAPAPASTDINAKLDEVARIHGGAGPWAVAGYRMGEYALRALGLERGSFDLEVVHFTPHEVQYSCIADGAAAATGASLGKLNLTLEGAMASETHTVYRSKSTGKSIALRLTKPFVRRFSDVPPEHLKDAGREVIQLRDEDVFETMP
jgi:formylmethanofuran dehydrogenase subunit E